MNASLFARVLYGVSLLGVFFDQPQIRSFEVAILASQLDLNADVEIPQMRREIPPKVGGERAEVAPGAQFNRKILT